MTVTASTALDPITALFLGALNLVLELASWVSTNQAAIISAIIVIVTIGVVVVFGTKISKFLGGLFDSILKMIKF